MKILLKIYLRNIRAAWTTYKAGQWPFKTRYTKPMTFRRWIFLYTLKFIKVRVFKLKF